VWGDPELTGKSRDGDLERRKLGYPVVAAHAAADEGRRLQLERLYESRQDGSPKGGASRRIRRLLDELGGAPATAAAPRERAAQAVAVIESCALAVERKQEFVDVANHVAERSR